MSRAPLPSRILIPVANPLTAEELVRIGSALLEPGAGSLTVLGIVEVPEGTPLSEGATKARQARRLLQRVLDFVPEGVAIHPIVRVGRRAAEGVLEAAAELDADLIVFGWGGKPASPRPRARQPVFSTTIDEVARDAPCDIAVVKQHGPLEVRRILVPIRGGPHAELALRFAEALGQAHGGQVAAFHAVPTGVGGTIKAQAEQALARFVRDRAAGPIEQTVREAASVRNAILKEAERADVVVMGASAGPAGGEHGLFGALPDIVASQSDRTVIVVRTRETIDTATFEKLAQSPESLAAADKAADEARAVPLRVERWFGESNFHHREFGDLERLIQIKEQQGLTVSLVLPTLNEAETIGPIVARARADLMERHRLVDELLVIDSDSTDRTREIAAAEGARVVCHPQVLAGYGSYVGKGEALWKSLYETSGEIVAWADTDVRNWHPRMVYGTVGPLITQQRIQYVKGYYRRPIIEDGVLKEGGGGRVTELVARPLLNLFFPELSGLIQPLAGEYAARRSLLESIPFFTGYAVEMGHLIDVADRVGLEGLGQVDLERRIHRNQDLASLTRMSFVILQAVMKRLEERHKAHLFAELGSTMKLPRAGHGQLGLEIIELADRERPPMATIPEYVARRAGGAAATEAGQTSDAPATRATIAAAGTGAGGTRPEARP
jgi:nucleotide-binding universal stress UspA family protein